MISAVSPSPNSPLVAVIIPSYRVKTHILSVISRIGEEIGLIVVVDDACPEGSGEHVRTHCRDPRVKVLTLQQNQGVGGAVMAGYDYAYRFGADIFVKVDGDGQMDPALIPQLIEPTLVGGADYTKGNRFYNVDGLRSMPFVRLFGNAALSFMTKMSSGYWNIFDPTNGFTALRAELFAQIPWRKVSRRYFFESDLLFRLNVARAYVVDVPMSAVYADEESGLKISRIIHSFFFGNLLNSFKRISYNYFLRDFTIGSIQLLVGVSFLLFGSIFGSVAWYQSAVTGVTASTGTVMLAALPVILGVQLLLSFLAFDIAATPSRAIHRLLTIRSSAERRAAFESENPDDLPGEIDGAEASK